MKETEKQNSSPLFRHALLVWLVLFAVVAAYILFLDIDAKRNSVPVPPWWQQSLIIAGVPSILLGVWLLLRWPFLSRRNFGVALIGLAALATLVAIFYLEEDWRGKRAWDQCKAELEAKGAVLDWNKLVPPPVPDDQNFFMVNTNFFLRFVKLQTEEQRAAARELSWLQLSLSSSNAFPILNFAKSNPIVVAELIAVTAPPNGANKNPNEPVIQLRDADARRQLQEIFVKTLGRCANGAQGFKFSELQLSNLTPAKVFVQADTLLTKDDFKNLVPADLVTNIGEVAVEPTAVPGVFHVRLVFGQITSAAEYLQWSDQHVPAFDEVREALKRPYAVIPGDYSMAYTMPIPNFVLMRLLAQVLAQRTQCYLLLNEPDQALRELTLMHDVCRILLKPPTGQPETLVEAMINVAIMNLYNSVVADGFKWQAWREPQIIALQEQLKSVNLYTPVVNGFKMEQTASAHTLLNTPPQKLAELFNVSVVSNSKQKSPFWSQMKEPMYWFLKFAPRGWIYQNAVVAIRLEQYSLDAFDVKTGRVEPRVFDRGVHQVENAFKHSSPFHFWAAIAVPNFAKAAQTMAYQQTLVNEGQVVCALERYKLASQSYPATLDELVPQYLEKVPSDLVGGQPLHYRRTDDQPSQSPGSASGKFVLYSVGWDEKDDGGQVVLTKDGRANFEKGDWVWK